jgi:1-acyl-sn-glycerol-3-phosphate acyltransferase
MLGSMSKDVDRAAFFDGMAQLLAAWGAGSLDALRPAVAEELADFSDAEIASHLERMETTGSDWGYFPADPIARHISRASLSQVLGKGSRVDDVDAVGAARRSPAVFLGNHLSFVDVNVLDYLMADSGYSDVAQSITTLVGPKVFATPVRRLASLCFGTIKLPQSTSRASGEAVMPPREVARLARRTIATAHQRQARGEHLLVFPEGSRTRTGGLQRCLAAVARYLETDALMIPWGHTGNEHLMPLDDDRARPGTEVRVRIGKPVPTTELFEACRRNRQLIADVAGFLISDLLPQDYRGSYAGATAELREAREIATKFS